MNDSTVKLHKSQRKTNHNQRSENNNLDSSACATMLDEMKDAG